LDTDFVVAVNMADDELKLDFAGAKDKTAVTDAHEKKKKGKKKICFPGCNVKNSKRLIGCDKDGCDIAWFHIECVSLEEEDIPDGTWYCPNCLSFKSKAQEQYVERVDKTVQEMDMNLSDIAMRTKSMELELANLKLKKVDAELAALKMVTPPQVATSPQVTTSPRVRTASEVDTPFVTVQGQDTAQKPAASSQVSDTRPDVLRSWLSGMETGKADEGKKSGLYRLAEDKRRTIEQNWPHLLLKMEFGVTK
jgi:hypothetical protein